MRTAIWLAMMVVALAAGITLADDTRDLQGKPAPDFSLQTVTDTPVKLSAQKGSVVLVDFWATWCPPCRKSLPHVQHLSENANLKAKGLVVWAVNARETADKVNAFMKQEKYNFTVPMDVNAQTMQAYIVHGIPTTVIVGRNGNIKAVFIGYGGDSAERIDKAVEDALAEKAG